MKTTGEIAFICSEFGNLKLMARAKEEVEASMEQILRRSCGRHSKMIYSSTLNNSINSKKSMEIG
jgi:uncharacterized protein (DUF1697 family)